MIAQNKKIICWDLDGTLGEFSKVSEEMRAEQAGEPLPDYVKNRKILVAHGMKDVLENLSNKGYLHVITTTGENGHPKQVLKRIGLEGRFEGIYEREQTKKFNATGKSYEDVAKGFGMSEEEASNNMIVIGDAWQDRPCDLENVVFVYHNAAFMNDSNVARQVIDKLNQSDPESHYKAFERLRQGNGTDNEKLIQLNKYISGIFGNEDEEKDYNVIELNDHLAIGLGHEECVNKGIVDYDTYIPEPGTAKTFKGPIINILPHPSLKKSPQEIE